MYGFLDDCSRFPNSREILMLLIVFTPFAIFIIEVAK